MKVLICDDNADFRNSLAPLLNCELVQAGTLAEGIERAPGTDIALLDLNMPDSSGMSTLDSFLEKVKDVPVVVITADPEDGLGKEAVSKGAEDFFIKTEISPKALENALEFSVRRFLKKRLDAEKQHRRAAEDTLAIVRPMVDALGELVAKLRTHLVEK